jgi:predicted cation transporter
VLVGGLLAIHQYTLKKTIISLLLTMLGIAIIAFIVFLAFGLIQQSISFFGAIISELLYRLK